MQRPSKITSIKSTTHRTPDSADRGTVDVEAWDCDFVSVDGVTKLRVTELIDRLTAVLAEIPEDYRDSATVNIRAEDPDINITWSRPETDREFAERRQMDRTFKKIMAQNAREELERLKKKYGG